MPMKGRNLPRPTLDTLASGGASTGGSGQNPFATAGAVCGPDITASAQQVPPGVMSASRPTGLQSSVTRSTSHPNAHQQPGRTAGNAGVMQSYVVSDSGGMLSLGEHYHVSSSGVREFRGDERSPRPTPQAVHGVRTIGDASAYELGLAATGQGPINCQHINELDFDNGIQIGRGSSGKVYNVLHTPSGLRVCVKQMTIDDARHREEIKRELDSLHRTASRFIVDFYGAFFHNDLGVILLVLELMEGSLLEVLRCKKRLTEHQAKAFALQVVHGLHTLHDERRLIHRDIKPANLLFHRSGQVKITDFGVSTGQRSQDPNSVQTFVGSILYMSPERLEAKSYGYDCDIWSLGITLCEAVSGYHPYQEDFTTGAEPLTFWGLLEKVMRADPERHKAPLRALVNKIPENLRPSVSDNLDSFVAKCLAFDKSDRASAQELLQHPWLTSITLEESERVVREIATEISSMRQSPVSTGVTPSGARGGDDLSVNNSVNLFTRKGAVPPPKTNTSTPTASTTSPGSDHTPSQLTPDEKRQKSDALLNELLSSVKR